MPVKNGRRTPQEEAAISTYAETRSLPAAMHAAGYGSIQATRNALARPANQAEIARREQARLFDEGLPLAVKVHIALLTDPKTPANAKVAAVKLMYERTLGDADAAAVKDFAEMSLAEMRTELARLSAEEEEKRAALAQIVDVEVVESSIFE